MLSFNMVRQMAESCRPLFLFFILLEGCGLSGKRISPIYIDEGGGIGRSERDIAECCPGTAVMPGLSVHGGSATSSDKCMEKWLRDGEVL